MKRIMIAFGLAASLCAHGASPFALTFATAAHGGPKNHLMVFITSGTGSPSLTNYVDTLGIYATSGNSYLDQSVTWRSLNGSRSFSADIKMGATRSSWTTPVAFNWDLKYKNGTDAPDGTYTIHIENVGENNNRRYATFQFVKDANARTQTVANVSTFSSIQVVYNPPAPPNTAPVSQNQNPSAVDGNPLAITLVATDAETNAITYHLLSQPATGHLLGTPPALTYLPVRGLTGSDSFTFNATDGMLTGNTATVTVSLVFNDSNSNGIPDSWQSAYGVTNAAADADGDGASNYEEYMAGTDPTNSASVFAVNAPPVTGGSSNLVLQWSSASNRYYAVQVSTNLVSGWSTLISNTPATPPVNTYTGAVNQTGTEYYRIRLDP
ncbi:MAG: cadherin-like domain-containing protein [Pontiellaceae bacterium]|jgi:hypothetical protein|nr:cadherin-like domain-containing protein [Pontiellaceae bacterium]